MESDPRPPNDSDRPLRVMPWWLVLAGLLLSAVAGWLVTTLLLAEADAGNTRAQLRIESIRTGLTVIAGVGGAVALVLAARRQWLSERAQRHQERIAALDRAHADRVQAHQEAVAAATRAHQDRLVRVTEQDATERRVTELFARAVEHLGSDKAAVRLGGLYALERLAARHTDQRPAIVDVICAYLRMPPGDEDWHVRLAAQRVLTRHLVVHDEPSFWPGVRVDLSGASLDRFDATGCTLAGADFRNAQFGGRSVFDRAAFDQSIAFAGCRFGDDVSFAAASWNCPAVFHDVEFAGSADFDAVTFRHTASFAGGTRFRGRASFRRAAFGADTVFDRTAFGGIGAFGEARFAGPASFEHATFADRASFRRAVFADLALFRFAHFGGEVVFEGARFHGRASFGRATFAAHVTFDLVEHPDNLRFDDARAATSALRSWPAGWREAAVDEGSVTVVRAGPVPDGG